MPPTTLAALTPFAAGEGIGFWRIGAEVYRAPLGAEPDAYGLPMGRRWEASADQWEHYRAVFAWAPDVAR